MDALTIEKPAPTPKTRGLYYDRLYLWVIAAVVAGALLGHYRPDLAMTLKPYGDAFIKAIKVVVIPLIFVTIVVGVGKVKTLKSVAHVGVKALIYFEIVSTLALITGLAVGNVWKVGAGMNANTRTIDTKSIEGYIKTAKELHPSDFFLNIIPNTFLEPFAKGDILPVIFLALLFGIAVSMSGEKGKPLLNALDSAMDALFGMVRVIMYAAPIGAGCAMAFTVGKFGLKTLLDLGELVASIYVVSILFAVIVFGALLRLAGFRLWRVLGYFKDEIVFVFAATSFELMVPRSMEKLEKLGVSRETVGLIMPAGITFNLDGTAIYMTMAVLFIAHAFNVELSMAQQFSILLVMLFTSKGLGGVTGAGFVALAATLPAVEALPITGLALLLGVDRFMAEMRAAMNLTSNVVATLVVGRWAGAVDMTRARAELGLRPA